MINIYDDVYKEKEFLSKEGILKYISDYDIFNHYIKDLSIGGITNSPLREVDDKPSFGVFHSEKHDMLLFKDMATGQKGDCFVLVKEMFCMQYKNTLDKIAIDFKIDEYFSGINTTYKNCSFGNGKIHDKEFVKSVKEKFVSIGVNKRDWSVYDRNYWSQYGITRKTLEKYNVFPIKLIFLNDKIIIPDKLAYAYLENKDGAIRYKIYQPYSKSIKWLNNFVDNTLSGFTQLPKTGDLLIIASSLKDGMCLSELGFNFIAPQAESNIMNPKVINNLRKRFKRIVVFFDNDKTGLEQAKRNVDEFNIEYITTENIFEKDPSDYYAKYGKSELIKILRKLN